MTTAEPVFVCDNVSMRWASGAPPALEHVSLTIRAGERVALIGPSGAGKTTLLGLLSGSLAPTSGTVRALGHNLARLSPRARRGVQQQIGTIYQQFHLVDNLRVVHNVLAGNLGRWSLARALASLVWPRGAGQAHAALARVGIAEKLYARTSELSGGERQRVALARVLVQNPRAILADEPVASLDPQRAREVLDLLQDLAAPAGRTLIASLHQVVFARSHFARVIGLRAGRVVFDRPTSEVSDADLAALYQT